MFLNFLLLKLFPYFGLYFNLKLYWTYSGLTYFACITAGCNQEWGKWQGWFVEVKVTHILLENFRLQNLHYKTFVMWIFLNKVLVRCKVLYVTAIQNKGKSNLCIQVCMPGCVAWYACICVPVCVSAVLCSPLKTINSWRCYFDGCSDEINKKCVEICGKTFWKVTTWKVQDNVCMWYRK